ncbi:MAG TPA: DUF1178 family protein [Allosphingosinicella sp.]|nr:DUF1178 family protein [Allosphingosinicella sp.]
MIIFDLKCGPQGHVFEAWFGSTEDYEAQRARGLVACPICGAGDVDKAPMAPNIPAKGAPPKAVKAVLADMAAAQKKMLAGSDFVGDKFADEARAIHLGESEARAIHGQATPQEAEDLRDEGIPVAPLPFPVPPPETEN